jgi:hypothetical protein
MGRAQENIELIKELAHKIKINLTKPKPEPQAEEDKEV